MKRFRFLVLILIFLIARVPHFLYAQNKAEAPKTITILDYQTELKLTDSQVNQIKAHVFDFEKKAGEINVKLTSLRGEITDLLGKEGDFNEIKKKVKEYYETMADLELANFEAGSEISKVLTPEQAKKWKEIRMTKLNETKK
jgi:Spy/CpxP family protein refolding chaperone